MADAVHNGERASILPKSGAPSGHPVMDCSPARFQRSNIMSAVLTQKPNACAHQPLVMILGASFLNRRASSAASANSQARNVLIFGTLALTFGQTIQ